MTDFINALFSLEQATIYTPNDIILAILLSFILAMTIGWVYKITHRGTSYSQAFVHTLVLMGMVVAVIMLIIGSNIARAFSLVGALSIIRFRNAVKDTRDVGYIFFAMAMGMAVGTQFYLLATLATGIICFLLWAMVKFDLFAKEIREQVLKIRLPGDMPYETLFETVFSKYLVRADLIAVETVQAGTVIELVYGIELKKAAEAQPFMQDLRKLNDNHKVSLITGQHEVDL